MKADIIIAAAAAASAVVGLLLGISATRDAERIDAFFIEESSMCIGGIKQDKIGGVRVIRLTESAQVAHSPEECAEVLGVSLDHLRAVMATPDDALGD